MKKKKGGVKACGCVVYEISLLAVVQGLESIMKIWALLHPI